MNEYFPTVVQVIPLDNFHEQVLLHGRDYEEKSVNKILL